MKRLLSTVCGLLFAYSALAQVSVMAVSQKFQFTASELPNSEPLDTSIIVANYHYKYPTDNFKDGFTSVEDDITVQLSQTMSKTFSQNLHLMDRRRSYGEENSVRFRLDYNDWEYFYDITRGEYTVNRRIPYSQLLYGNTQVVEYSAPIENPEWKINPTIDSLLGYKCMTAEGRVGGREWKVWFTTDVPARANLWLFGGLPGLVLKAEDKEGVFCFECYQVRQVSVPIEKYKWRPTRMSKDEWLKTEREMYANPLDYFSPDGELRVIGTDRNVVESWSVRYAPLELK